MVLLEQKQCYRELLGAHEKLSLPSGMNDCSNILQLLPNTRGLSIFFLRISGPENIPCALDGHLKAFFPPVLFKYHHYIYLI